MTESMYDDVIAATKARDAAMKQVKENADKHWLSDAREAVRTICASATPGLDSVFGFINNEWTSDDVWKTLRLPREPRALGPVINAAVKAGWCEATGRYVKSKRKSRHRAPIAVYRSLL